MSTPDLKPEPNPGHSPEPKPGTAPDANRGKEHANRPVREPSQDNFNAPSDGSFPELSGASSSELSLGDQELALLRYIAAREAVTVGEAAEGFGAPQNLSRSTIVTVMERLRKKGYLTRKKHNDVFRYSCPVAQDELMGGVVRRFVEKTLAGSLSPFVRYFASSDKLSPQEVAELERLIGKLQAGEEK